MPTIAVIDIDKGDDLRKKFYRNIFVFFVKWILTVLIIFGVFGMATGRLPILLKETNFLATILILFALVLCGYAWYVDIHLFLKRRREKKPLLTDPLIIEFVIILVFAFLVAWYFFPSLFQKETSFWFFIIIGIAILVLLFILIKSRKKILKGLGFGKPSRGQIAHHPKWERVHHPKKWIFRKAKTRRAKRGKGFVQVNGEHYNYRIYYGNKKRVYRKLR